MTTTTRCCPACRRDHDPHDCARRLRSQLQQILTLTALAGGQLTPTSSPDHGRSGKPGSRPPVNLDALNDHLAHDTLAVLEDWQRAIRADYRLAPYGQATEVEPATLTTAVAFLDRWVQRLVDDQWEPVADLAQELRTLVSRLQRWDPEQPRTTWTITCPADTGSSSCGARIHVNADIRADITCAACHTRWTSARLIAVAAADPASTIWVDADTAAAIAGCTTRWLRKIAQGGTLTRRGGRYLLHEVHALNSAAV